MAEPKSNPRHSILDLAPLELDCMNALWPLGEATVRDIQGVLAPTRPRAYTTIMTILDRLSHKGIVLRRKAGRAWVYRPSLSAEEARSDALAKIVNGFFDGSAEALSVHLTAQGASTRRVAEHPAGPEQPVMPRTLVAPKGKRVGSSLEGSQASPGLDTSLL
jgi:predicted transcriptional regulator